MMRNLKQTYIWLKRFRYRCGYGVHSPFAFNFITNVIYERGCYYAYQELEGNQACQDRSQPVKTCKRLKKVHRLLFRLVNYIQPSVIIDAGEPGIASLYMRTGKKNAEYISVVPSDDKLPQLLETSSFYLYIHCPEEPDFVRNIFDYCIGNASKESLVVIGDIYRSDSTKALWKQIIDDERVGITFDLYDVGILFFDKSKIKQHYTVNF